MKPPGLIMAAAINLFLAVAAGAFGAHGLKTVLSLEMLAIWQTAVHYQMIHALGLLAIAMLGQHADARWLARAAIAFLLGMVIFSGSLYLLALSGLRWLGAITPLGGLAFLAGWAMLAWAAWLQRR
ncbi:MULTISPECIES: DUF423 domain-containing protein [unclassified Undibacterium]|uniref:DUF423 domain-containing protein n=1 Tax=unclassified Undibacterium TaxID=2630295 RepID=UPI002AC9724A|nr:MULTISPECIES: DUF423 domain-containing protein [unclassified Undibacterium]MEB0138965.1 DUF423 domain-containing protein [Undibacterium sp. CCC2.1]MEB0171940.1 DUF423 domain-containing protein [Undibacterium sp. CCC1.1]MEB0175881.1 DUF423 domain-containing protein [Undibacterium sp. CCC3.4]MEB0215053.1 DUF423 domain-containing protein [Undibacterium sp. 5I2]WPX45025.1 DUF423 domain-containing protein [Undibacterium sp. CCC3.4]